MLNVKPLSTDETPQIVPTDPAANVEGPAASTGQPTDVESTTDITQEGSAESVAPEAAGFQATEQSAAVQQPSRDVFQQTQSLHVCLGPLPDMHACCKAFYFLRDQPGKVALEDMDTQRECGILSEGPSLKMLQQVVPRSRCSCLHAGVRLSCYLLLA